MKAKFYSLIRATVHTFNPIKLVLLCFIFGSAQIGYSVPINILQTQYYTAVLGGATTRTQTSSSPLTDSVFVTGRMPDLQTYANANLLGVSGYTYTLNGFGVNEGGATTYAESDLWFTPLSSQTVNINVQYDAGFNVYSAGNFNLLDVTSGNELWNYGWNGDGGAGDNIWSILCGAPTGINDGTTLPVSTACSGSLNLESELNATDTYELIMRTGSDSDNDQESESMQLTGVEPAPEPSPLILEALGILSLTGLRKMKLRS